MGAREVLLTIHQWMGRLRTAVTANRLKTGALAAFAGLLTVSLLLLILETLGRFPGSVRAVLLTIWGVSVVAAVGLGIVWPVLRSTVFHGGDKKLAGEYARRMPTIRDRVLNALQLLDKAETADREGYSADLILEAGRSVAEDLRPIDPKYLPDRRPVKISGRAALISAAAAVLLFALAGRPLVSAAERMMKPDQEFEPPAPFSLTLGPGDVTLVRGDSLRVVVRAEGAAPEQVVLERLERGKTAAEPVTLDLENDTAKYTYRGVTSPFTYRAHSGRVQSATCSVRVKELPAVRFLSVRLSPPDYTGLEDEVLEENIGDIAAVVGTRVTLQAAATKTLSSAGIEFLKPRTPGSDEEEIRGMLRLDITGSRSTGEFTVDESGYYRILLTDTEGLSNSDPILYRITARPDEPPMISIVDPPRDIEIAAGAKVPVVAEAADDFGFTKMNLRFFRTSSFELMMGEPEEKNYSRIPLDYKMIEPGHAAAEYLWDLAPLDLLPDDQLMVFVEVWDNDRISGPKRARSEVRVFRFPSMAEIFEQEEQQAEAQKITLADLLEQSEDLREKVEEAVEEYKSNPDLSWERKKEIEDLLEKQRAMTEVLEKVAEAMEQASQQMEQRAMFSPEVMEKLRKVQQLAQEVITPEMREAMQKLAEAMKQPSEEEMRRALENFQMTQEMFEQALDQALNMLEQLKIEQKLDELTRRLDELGRKQDQLNQKMDSNTPETAQQNSEEQKRLSEEMRKIEDEMRKLAEQMKKQNMPGSEEMQQLQQEAEEENLSEQMEQNSQSMSACQNSMCKKKGKRARRKMADFANACQNIKQMMQQDMMAEVLEKLERTRDQMLDLSHRQEQLWRECENLDASSPQHTQAAEEQENLRQALSRVNSDLLDLARESMFVTPKLMSSLYEALKQMQSACNSSQSRDPRIASYYRLQSLAALNSALKECQGACSNCQSSCNKPNPNSCCNKAGQMSLKQGQINQQTQQMFGACNNPQGLTQGEAATMQRLAAEQNALAKSADELAAEASASRQSLGRIDDLAEEMRDVAKDLENRNITDRTLSKQERIESRLLDFQRATREREFSPRRRATTGVDIVRSSPRELPEKPGKDELRADLLRALETKYTPDYEKLIRLYFDALAKWK